MFARHLTASARFLLAGLLLVGFVGVLASCADASKDRRPAAAYRCPMHPGTASDRPGDCPLCGMRLVPTDAGERTREGDGAVGGAGRSPVVLSAEVVRRSGIETAVATRGRLARSVRAAANILADPARVQHVVIRTDGRIERLEVKAPGARVLKGQPLFTLYAPEIVPIQEEYVRIARATDGSGTPEGQRLLEERRFVFRQRLVRYGIPEEFLAELDQTGTAKASIPFAAPSSGFVQMVAVFEGQQVTAGTELMTLTDLSKVWVEASLFEQEMAGVKEGLPATVTLPFDARAKRVGRVVNVSPFLDTASRTLKVRVLCPNPDLALKPGMYAAVELAPEPEEGILVPSPAVMDTGLRSLAYVERGEGRFEPQEVRVGFRAGGMALILSGISPGERVVVRSNFLLDAESRLAASESATGEAGPPP